MRLAALGAAVLMGLVAGCVGRLEGSGDGTPSVNTGGSGGGGGGTPGTGGGAGTAGGIGNAQCDQIGVDSGASVLRRLSMLEYQLTLQDLFQLEEPPSVEGLPPDTDKKGFKSFAELQTVSAQHLRGYLDKAAELADGLLADPERSAAVIGCTLTAPDCLTDFIARFGKLAFRRALTEQELDAIGSAAVANALDEPDRFRYAIEALLGSPKFLFRLEVGDSSEPLATLGPLELAARLSFTLWGRAPSAELLDRAAAGALDTSDGLSAVAAEMLADPRAEQFFAAFFRQWLGFDVLRQPVPEPADWSEGLLAAMARETELVTAEFAWGGQNFLDVLTTNTTRLGPELAAFYGLNATGPDSLVQFPADHPRADTGLLTHASLLSAKSDGDPIALRGNWLRKTFLCSELHAPPDLADTIGELLVGQTRQQIVETRNTRAECSQCHAAIDPIGVGFAQFDATGRFDPSLDDAGVYGIEPGLPDAAEPGFSTIAELAAKLRSLPRVSACLSERAFLYTNGREPEALDVCAVQSAQTAFADSNNDFGALLKALVEAPAFRLRRAPPAL